MFKPGDLVTIKPEYRHPDETNMVYKIVNVNEGTQRCYITPAACTLPLAPQELVSFRVLEAVKD